MPIYTNARQISVNRKRVTVSGVFVLCYFRRNNVLQLDAFGVYLWAKFQSLMKVYKFGGASVKDHLGIKNIALLLDSCREENLLIVVSAMGKTTNALERVAELFYHRDTSAALTAFGEIKSFHLDVSKSLLSDSLLEQCDAQLLDLLTEVEWLLHDQPVRDFAYYYDQIVCIGELLSSTILHYFLLENHLPTVWLDVRDVLRTDKMFREAHIDWPVSASRAKDEIAPLLQSGKWVVTQGFVGSTADNESTTLGREGSDFTAAVFAHLLDAASVTIWKDVEGVMNADPKQFTFAEYLPHLNYAEVIEMAYYGAQIIHPKTIKPLQNKQIPLFVKCFYDKRLPGTVIDGSDVGALPPLVILKKEQIMLKLETKNFDFVAGENLNILYSAMLDLGLRPNQMQIGAIKLILVLDNKQPEKINQLLKRVATVFQIVQQSEHLQLLTIRYYNNDIIKKTMNGISPLLIQKSLKTFQALY